MKSYEELVEIRNKTLNQLNVRNDHKKGARVVVGMGTCGIAAGARPVLNAFVEDITNRNMTDTVTIAQTGCLDMCRLEPVVEVTLPGQEKVTYVHMTAEKVAKVVEEHIINGKPVKEFTAE